MTREQRLDSPDESTRWFMIIFGAFLVGGGVVLLVIEMRVEAARWASLLGFLPGAFLLWLGVSMKKSYCTEEGLLRAGWTGEEVVPWSRVDSIELDEVPTRYETVGWVRLRIEGGRTVGIRAEPDEVGRIADRIAKACPQAFRDDRRSGTILAPVGLDPALTAERGARIRARAARSQRILGGVWIGTGVFCGLVSAACIAYLFASGNLEALFGAATLGIGTWICIRTGRVKMLLARITELPDGPTEGGENAPGRPS